MPLRISRVSLNPLVVSKAVLAPDFGEPRHVLENEKTGFLVANNPDAFAGKVVGLESKKDLLDRVGKEALAKFEENYSQAVLMERMLSWSETI